MPAVSSHSNSRKYILLSYLRSRSDSEAEMTMSSISSDYPSNFAAVAVKGLSETGHDPPNFKRSVNPISTRGGRLCSPHYYLPHPPGFSDLPTSLSSVHCTRHCTSTNTIDIKHQNSRMARQDTSSYITELSILCHGFDDMSLF